MTNLPRNSHDWLRQFVTRQTGNTTIERSDAAVDNRLRPLLANHKFGSIDELVQAVQCKPSDKLIDAVVAALMNNETSFFRDPHCFDELRDHVLPELIARRSHTRTLNIWSAACSTGQEPCSMAILLLELLGPKLEDWNVSILATDVSTSAVGRATKARFSTLEVRRGLSADRLRRHFAPDRERWRFDTDLRRMIKTQRLNLIDPWPMLPRMDLILLRNVLIYLEPTSRESILDRLASQLKPDGVLVLGAPETIIEGDRFTREIHGRLRVYRPAQTV